MRRLFCLLLLICLPLQSFALQFGQLHGAGIAHEIEHDQGVAHHHHEDDGAVHYDDSEESAWHVLDHSASSLPFGFPLPDFAPVPPLPLVTAGPGERTRHVPDPHLECPDKPPAFSLGQAAEGRVGR